MQMGIDIVAGCGVIGAFAERSVVRDGGISSVSGSETLVRPACRREDDVAWSCWAFDTAMSGASNFWMQFFLSLATFD